MGVGAVRLTGGEPLVRRDFPRLAAMLAALPRVDDLALTTNGFLLERDAAALVEAGDPPLQRLDRLAPARPLLRDDAARRAAARAARARGARRLPRGAPDQGQRGRDPRLHRAGGAAVRRVRARAPLRGALHRVHAARRRPRVDAGAGPDRRRDPRSDRTRSTRWSPSRASRAPRRASTGSPTARAGSASSTRSASRSAATATASASPPTGRLRTCLFSLNETDLREPLRAGRERRRARADHPRRGLAQGAQAPRQRARASCSPRGRCPPSAADPAVTFAAVARLSPDRRRGIRCRAMLVRT